MSSRRRFLSVISAGLATAAAGCTDGGEEPQTTDRTTTEGQTTTDAGTTATGTGTPTETTSRATTTTNITDDVIEGTYPTVMATPGRTGVISGVSGPRRGVERVWRTLVDSPREGPFPPMLVDDSLYAAAGFTVARIDPVDGGVDWTAEFDGPINAAPTVGGDTVFVTTRTGLYALEAGTGDQRYLSKGVRTYTGNVGPPVRIDDTVFVPASGSLYAADAATGEVAWNERVENAGTVALGAGNAVVGASGRAKAVSLSDGSSNWAVSGSGSQQVTPRVANGRTFVNAKPTEKAPLVVAYDRNGETLWTTALEGDGVRTARISGMAVGEGQLFVATDIGTVHSLSPDDGTTNWRNQLREGEFYRLTVADGTVYSVNDVNNLVAIDADTGTTFTRSSVASGCYVPPVVWNDTVYLMEGQHVYAYA